MAHLNIFGKNNSYLLRVISDLKGLWYVVIGMWPEMMMKTEENPKNYTNLNNNEILDLIYETKPEYCQVINYKRPDMSEKELKKHEEDMEVKFKKNEFSEILSKRPVAPIVMRGGDVLQLANEIRRVVGDKREEDVKLNLTFTENNPKFNIKIKFKNEKFDLTAGFNINYSSIKDERHDNQYLYRDGGVDDSSSYDYSDVELLTFADDLEEETHLL